MTNQKYGNIEIERNKEMQKEISLKSENVGRIKREEERF